MPAKFFRVSSSLFARSLAAIATPFLILLLLFQLQRSFGALHYLNPIARYVFIIGSTIATIQLAKNGFKLSNHPCASADFPKSRTAFIFIWSSISSLCLLVLLINWSSGGTQEYSAIGGVLPWSDAADYYDGALRLLDDGHLTNFSERRPLNALFFAARLFVAGNNFFVALIIQTLLCALALSLATSAVLQTHGKTIALIFFVICFAFVGTCVQRTLSEALGITLGLVAFALQWTGISRTKLTPYAIGAFVLALALLARAGAMFVLPASILFAAMFFPGNWRKRFIVALTILAAIAGAWVINFIMIRLYGTGSNGALLSNFSYVIYGLSQGGVGWTKAVTNLHLSGGEADVTAFLYRKSMDAILAEPTLLVWGLSKRLARDIVAFPMDIFRLIADGSDGSSPTQFGHVVIAAIFATPAILLGIFGTLKAQGRRLDRFQLYLLICLGGFIISLPFFYLDGGIRLTAATFPITAATIAIMFSTFASKADTTRARHNVFGNAAISYAITAAVIITSLALPKLAQLTHIGPTTIDRECNIEEKSITVRIGDGSAHLNIVTDLARVNFAPNIRKSDFTISDINEDKQEWRSLNELTTVLIGFETKSKAFVRIIGPIGFADGPSILAPLCAVPLKEGIFSYRVIQQRQPDPALAR